MPTTIITPSLDAIVGEIQIAAPAERVFKALTDASELQCWFGGPECPVKVWTMDARVGGHYSYATQQGSIVVNGVSAFECQGEILECNPPRLLVYTWIANWHDDPKSRTVVRWELTQKGSATHVRVTHSGLSNLHVARKDYTGGWPEVVEMLKKFVEGRD
jgi:uncharacterized protein YndB with AHSA1/START domain